MSSLETKSIKQTSVNGTLQPLKIGGILEDGSDSVISVDSDGAGQIHFSSAARVEYNSSTNSIDFIFN